MARLKIARTAAATAALLIIGAQGGDLLAQMGTDADTVTTVPAAPAPPAPAAAGTATQPPKSDAPVPGFGKDVPIGTALHDVVPPGTNVRFAPGASPRTRVDWTGGADWRTTVRSIAESVGMTADIGSDTVSISKPGAPPPPAASRPSAKARPARRATPAYAARGAAAPAGGRYDSPTVDGMTDAQAAAETPPPANAYGATPAAASTATSYTSPGSYAPADTLAGRGTPQPDGGPAAYGPGRPLDSESDTPASIQGTWRVADGSTLLGTLQAWCKQAGGGWTVYPKTQIVYRLHGSMTFHGTLIDATEQLVTAIRAPIMPYAQVHRASRNIILTDEEHNSISMGSR